MNKFTYAAVSLIGAVPALYLSYELVMAMKEYFPVMAGMMRAVVCGILGLSVVVTVIPVGILIFVKDETAESETDDDEEALEDAEDEVEEIAGDVEEAPAEVDADDAMAELPDFEAAGIDDAEASVMIEHSSDELEELADDIYEADEEHK